MTGKIWQRPVPQIGDTTSSHDRASEPDGWAFDASVIEAIGRVIDARRDIRRYRSDPVPSDLVREVIEAGHHGPSVGHSQPWRFIIIDDAELRDQAAVMADRERLRQAELLTQVRRDKLLDLQLEGIREAPLGIVVACDRRTPSSGVLGRNTFTDADLWSCAAAIENMWLAARARGLGMGWVTLFRPTELADLLGLPDGVETLGWMCLGWPDERPPEPGLQRRAWSHRLALDDVIMHNHWPQHNAPAAPPSGLPDEVFAPSQDEVVAAHDAADRLLTPPGSLGVLDSALDRIVAAGGAQITDGTLVLAGADHPVASRGVTAFEPSVTREVMNAAVSGEALGTTAAANAGIRRCVIVDAGVFEPIDGARRVVATGHRGDLRVTDGVLDRAMTARDAEVFADAGRAIVRELSTPQLICLGEVGVGNTTIASALAAAFTGMSPADAVGVGASSDAAMVERKISVVAPAVEAALRDGDDPMQLLAALGGPELAVLTGVVREAARGRHIVVLDGLATSVAALAAVKLEPAVQSHLVAGQVSREVAHRAVLDELGLEPLLNLRLRAGEGVGACLAAQMLLSGLAVRRSAAVTE